ncbi:glycosyltransferase [Kineococcus rubinsiae]|uniref:glycosyltransferase n=1 Tax=Kineococcus rubinsiae TaxID=2609562 RepID=UPI0014309356|nr:glycosyltransferase family 2 protein [Kineococcus rubinsiae]NIZ91113.1 glycosyltransferase family 2 protein [Kineococcus rubinsiae]
MSSSTSVAVFMCVGPRTPVRHVLDTIDSAEHWIGDDLDVLVAVDDSGDREIAAALEARAPRVRRVPSGRVGSGVTGGLYAVTCRGMRAALDLSDAPVVLQLDTDALVVGPTPQREAVARLGEHPDVGLLGSCRTTCTGARRDFSPAAQALREDLRNWRHPVFAARMHLLRARARRHGYERGEHLLGAAYFTSRACLEDLRRRGLLNGERLRRSTMADDQLLSLVVRSAGWRIGDFSGDGEPLAVVWKGLPWPVEEITRRGKKIVHSTKDHGDVREDDVRRYFAALRR